MQAQNEEEAREMTGRHRQAERWYEMTPEKAFWLFLVFATIVFLTGGGSRHDIESIGPLRFVAAIVLAIAVYFQTAESFRRVGRPVVLLLLLAALMVIQLIPLPPSWWSSLPGREEIIKIDELLGLSDLWRPLTFSPMKTANSLASLVVPLAALLVLALLDNEGWSRVRKVIVFAGLASALLGLAQITLPESPGLYLYEITNRGSAVGLFSNRNHNALFLNIALLFSLFESWKIAGKKSRAGDLLLAAVQMVLLLAILINGSRFGLVLLGFVGLVFAVRLMSRSRTQTKTARAGNTRNIVGLAIGLLALGLVGLFIAMSRIPALERLFSQSLDDDLRAQTLPHILGLMGDHFPYGVGFGAFEHAYRTIEPVSLLGPHYLNNAHNDWLQIVIEGGAAALILLVAGIYLLMKQAWLLWKARHRGEGHEIGPWLGFLTLAMMAMHSTVDYPLRTPILMLVAATALAMIFRPRLAPAVH